MSNANRKLNKQIKETSGMLNTPCTITEAVQIARGVADDAIADYHKKQGNVQLAISLHLEIMKDILISSGMITEEEFKEKYMEKAIAAQRMQESMAREMQREVEADTTAQMSTVAGDVEVSIEE